MEKTSFGINVSGARTTEEVIAAGKYDWDNDLINGKNFPIRPMPAAQRKIVFLEFGRDISSEEVLAEAECQGLERPRYEDALFFGEQHPGEQRKTPIVFLHEPWQSLCHELDVLVLSCGVGGRALRVDSSDNIWQQRCRFAFVEK